VAQEIKNIIHFEIPFQDHEQYKVGRTKQRDGRRFDMSALVNNDASLYLTISVCWV